MRSSRASRRTRPELPGSSGRRDSRSCLAGRARDLTEVKDAGREGQSRREARGCELRRAEGGSSLLLPTDFTRRQGGHPSAGRRRQHVGDAFLLFAEIHEDGVAAPLGRGGRLPLCRRARGEVVCERRVGEVQLAGREVDRAASGLKSRGRGDDVGDAARGQLGDSSAAEDEGSSALRVAAGTRRGGRESGARTQA